MKGTYEIRSKATGKVVYSASADDVAADWNYKKRRLIMGWDNDKKLEAHIAKFGIKDLYLIPKESKYSDENRDAEEEFAPEIKKQAKKGSRKKK